MKIYPLRTYLSDGGMQFIKKQNVITNTKQEN